MWYFKHYPTKKKIESKREVFDSEGISNSSLQVFRVRIFESILCSWSGRVVKFGQALLIVYPLEISTGSCQSVWLGGVYLWFHHHHRSLSIYVGDQDILEARQKCPSLCGLDISWAAENSNQNQHMAVPVGKAQTTRKVCFSLSISLIMWTWEVCWQGRRASGKKVCSSLATP